MAALALDIDPGADRSNQFAPGEIAPKEGSAQQARQPDLGPNNENLQKVKPKVVESLRSLDSQFRSEGIAARRHEIKRVRRAHLFWMGLHYSWWNPTEMHWNLPNAGHGLQGSDTSEDSLGRYQFVTNIYQGYGLKFIALVSQDIPHAKFAPKSASNAGDVTAAKGFDDVADIIERNNAVQDMLVQVGFYLWNDGKIGGYVRFVVDGQRFGFRDEDQVEQASQPMGQDMLSCAQCGAEQPADGGFMAACQQCGAPLTEDNLRMAQSINVPQVTGSRRVPNGQEVISIIGGLELNTPVWANEQHEFPYLQWQQEVHKTKLKAVYPHVADKIQVGQATDSEDVYARTSRISIAQGMPLTHPGDNLQNVVTYTRTWMRPWAFYLLEQEDERDELLKMFPDGCFVAFAGDTYCESRNENMDDHWRVMHALPGDGQSRPSVGDSLTDVQEQVNTRSNIEAENEEFGIPPTFADPNSVDFEALANQVAEPGALYPAKARGQNPLAASFFQPAPGQISPQCAEGRQELMNATSQFLTGLFPAVFGGAMPDADTLGEYAIAREQAMGQIGLVWRRVKKFYAELMYLACDCFRKNRPEDVETAIRNDGGEYEAKWIRLADLRGNVQIEQEEDEQYPVSRSQKRAVIEKLLTNPDPAFQQVIEQNMETIRDVFGLQEFSVPGEGSRLKQQREIEQLLQAQPIEQPPQVDPMGQQMGPPPPPMSSVPIDELLDDHEAEFNEIKRWASSDAGQSARAQNPAGFANVSAHAQAHMQVIQQSKGGGQKPPSESINLKDLPPGGKVQMAAQAGIQLSPEELMQKEAQDRHEKADQLQARMKGKPQ